MRCCLLLTWLAAIPRISAVKCFMSLFIEINMKKVPRGEKVIRNCPEKGKEIIALFWWAEKKRKISSSTLIFFRQNSTVHQFI